jgi:hypothetical protein
MDGSTAFNLYSPAVALLGEVHARHRAVAVQVEIESKTLKPGNHMSFSRVESMRFQAQGQVDSTCKVPPNVRQERAGASWNSRNIRAR